MTQPTTDERHIARFEQNSENFRGLNGQMWQIPILGMTLTGGLWFGVSNVKESPLFQISLLALACVGNLALIMVLHRLRFVMDAYLNWIVVNEPEAKIDASGPGLAGRSNVVRTTFQIVLGLTALISLLLLGVTLQRSREQSKAAPSVTEAYDAHAIALADEYEGPAFVRAHPALTRMLRQGPRLSILDLGSAVQRDAEAMTAMGHVVAAGLPSARLVHLARSSAPEVRFFHAPLPELPGVSGRNRFDIIVLNGAWARVVPSQRQVLIDRLLGMLRPGGRVYLAFRDGPEDQGQAIYRATVAQVRRLTGGAGYVVQELESRPDLAGRSDVRWRTVLIGPSRK